MYDLAGVCSGATVGGRWFGQHTNERFKKTFRISKNTFSFILNRIRNDLERQTVNEDPISPECRLGICLYRPGRGDYYYTIAEMTGLGK